MDLGKPSRTSEGVAIARALHQLVDERPLILDDPIAPLMVDEASDTYRLRLERADEPDGRLYRTQTVVRSRYAEDCLADAVVRGVRQNVVLGAGLDTFAYRQPDWARELRIFEVDHPATQAHKRARLAGATIEAPGNLVFVPIDFETQLLTERLGRSGFDFEAPTFCSWLGVTMYLTHAAIDETLRTFRKLPPGSEIVLSICLPPEAVPAFDAERVRRLIAGMADTHEPWISLYRPEAMIAKLRDLGFTEVVHFSSEAAHARYCHGRRDGLTMPSHLHLMRAVV
jgi:methyltransferase (TIGR00027 family)